MLDSGKWDKFCEIKGLNPYCMNEGLADRTESVVLTPEEAAQLGVTLERKL